MELQEEIDITRQLIELHSRGIILGPFTKHNDPFNIIPSPIFPLTKLHPDGSLKKLRIVHNLSYIGNGLISINEPFTKEQRTLTMQTLQTCAGIAILIGRKEKMWVVDQKDAFYSVRLKKEAWKLMGFEWLNRLLCFNVASFGIARGPQWYNKHCLILKYIIQKRFPNAFNILNSPNNLPQIQFNKFMGPFEIYYINEYNLLNKEYPKVILDRIELFKTLKLKCNITVLIMNYVDEFVGGHWNSSIANKQFNVVKDTMRKLGLEPKEPKCEKPNDIIYPLGSVISVQKQFIALNSEKATKYKKAWLQIRFQSITKRTALSIDGKTVYASMFRPALKARARILRYHFQQLQLEHHKRINEFQSNNAKIVSEQLSYAEQGISLIDFYIPYAQCNVHLYTDAASTIGASGYDPITGNHFQFKWNEIPQIQFKTDIGFQEYFAVALMIMLIAKQYKNTKINIHCDNLPITFIASKHKCKFHRIDILAIMTIISDIILQHNILLWYSALPSSWNTTADELSRFVLTKSKQLPFPINKNIPVKRKATKLALAINSFMKNIKTGRGSAEFVKRFSLLD